MIQIGYDMEDWKMSTLYVTDLDGTLMRSDQALSRYTVETVNRLIEEGMFEIADISDRKTVVIKQRL